MGIKGTYTLNEQLPDRDLGRCVKEGRRNITSESRAFGKPSRGAPPRPVSSGPTLFRPPPRGPVPQCDGNDAGSVLVPDRFMDRGISSSEFARLRSREEIQSLMAGAGYQMSTEEFDRLWDYAVSQGGIVPPPSELALDAVIKAFADFHKNN